MDDLNGLFDRLPPEQSANFAPGGPVETARRFMDAIADADLRRAWPLVDRRLRLVLVRAWLDANAGHPILAALDATAADALAEAEPSPHELWDAFEATQLGEFADAWSRFDADTWGAASKPRVVGIDLELVVFVPLDGDPPTLTDAAVSDAIALLMRYEGAWRVAGLNTDEPPP